MTIQEQRTVQAFIATAPWQHTARGVMTTVHLSDDAIAPECMPPGVEVVDVQWWRRDASGCIPVRLRRRDCR